MTVGGIEYLDGWHGEEREEKGPFRWMTRDAACLLKGVGGDGPHYLIFTAGHPFAGPELPRLEVRAGGRPIGSKSIATSFSPYYFPIEGTGDIRLEFKLDRDRQIPGDGRRLGIMVRPLEIVSPADLSERCSTKRGHRPKRAPGRPGAGSARKAA
jgi:hypothetical protein